MPGGRVSDLTILIGAGTALVALSLASFLIAPVDTTPQIDGSSFANHPSGARAAFLALKQSGYDVRQSYEPLALARPGPRAVLILADPLLPPSQGDVRALLAFIEQGGTVLATGGAAGAFLPGLPWKPGAAAADAEAPAPVAVDAAIPSRLSEGVPRATMVPAQSALTDTSRYVTIYGTNARPAILAARIGKGTAIWWSGSTPLTNAGVAESRSIDLLVNVIGDPAGREVWWDEHYHGHSRSLASYVRGTSLPFAGAQLGLVMLAALLAFSRRRWPIRAAYAEPRASPLEFVDSMGALYQRANVAAGIVGTVRARVRRLLATACGLPPGTPDEHLSRAAGARAATPPARLQALLAASADAAANPNLRPQDARRLVAELQQVSRALRHGRQPPRP
jgi:hypothetical protein